MNERGEPHSTQHCETARDFVFALPAGLVIFFHVLVALMGLTGVITGLSDWDSLIDTYRLLILALGLTAAVAGIAVSAVLWARRSWWVLLVPAVTLPWMLASAFWYVNLSWGS